MMTQLLRRDTSPPAGAGREDRIVKKKKYRWQKYVSRDLIKNSSHRFRERLSQLLAAVRAAFQELDELESSPVGQAMRRRCRPDKNGGPLPVDRLMRLTTLELRKLDDEIKIGAPIPDSDISAFIGRIGRLIKLEEKLFSDIAAELTKRLSVIGKDRERCEEITAIKQARVSLEGRWKSGCDRLQNVSYQHIESALRPLLPPTRSE